jgi:hypothetical protein
MMKSISLDDSADTDEDWDQLDHSYTGPQTPSTDSPESNTQPHRYDNGSDGSDEEYGRSTQLPPRKGGYDSRIQQYLYEYPHHPIMIIEGGKSVEGGGKYIVYTIRTGVCLRVFYSSFHLWYLGVGS